jgi:hypothetical protein
VELISKIRDHGVKWFFQRVVRELQFPTRPWTQRPIDGLIRLKRAVLFERRRDSPYLRAVYDLEVGANTYDFACFLVAAEMEATRQGLPGYEVVLLPKYRKDLYDSDYARIVDDPAQQWRLQELLIPLTLLSARCKGVLVVRDRDIAAAYIEGYRVFPELYGPWSLRAIDYVNFYRTAKERGFEGLAASEHARRAVSRWLHARNITKPPIVITLRGYGHDPARDSNLPEWRELSHHIAGLGFEPIIIPDTEAATENPPGDGFSGRYFLEACWNLDIRMAMYESAYVSLFVNNGPAQLPVLSRTCRYIIFKWAAMGSPLASVEFLASRGLEPGKPFPFAMPWQYLIWEEDTYATMSRHLKAFMDAHPA